jgi:hypothetical protein
MEMPWKKIAAGAAVLAGFIAAGVLVLSGFAKPPLAFGEESPVAGTTPAAMPAPDNRTAQLTTIPPSGSSVAPAVITPADASPARLSCRAVRNELGIFEPLRFLSITIDVNKKYVKMVHEGDGKTVEYTGDSHGAYGGVYGGGTFVKVTDDYILYGQGRESWKIDRYTGTLLNPSIGFPFECQLRASDRKF